VGQQTIYGQFGQFSQYSWVGQTTIIATDTAGNPGGTVAWVPAGGGPGATGGSASATLSNSTSHWLQITNGFGGASQIPANATITGVQVAVPITVSGAPNVTFASPAGLVLVKAGVAQQNTIPKIILPAFVGGGGGRQTFIIGGTLDLWGANQLGGPTLAPADITNQFGVAFAFNCTAANTVTISYPVQITVYYTTPTSSGVILQDSSSNPQQSQWTNGASIIAPVGAGPGLMNPWSILGWGISFLGQLIRPTGLLGFYGRLGEIWGGLVVGSPKVTLGPVPWISPLIGLPGDLSTLSKIWDGSVDPPFPRADGPTAVATVPNVPKYSQFTYPLPIPVAMQPGDQIGIGLWLTPSLVLNNTIQLADADWSISYDDGVH
jgi:hypothetical protein